MLKKEHILAVNSETIKRYISLELHQNSNEKIYKIDLDDFTTFVENSVIVKMRHVLEEDPTYKQLIPYVVIRNKNNQYLTYVRGTGVGENRLEGKASIGIGGHIDINDIVTNDDSIIELNSTLALTGIKEILEEVKLTKDDDDELTTSFETHVFDNLFYYTEDIYLIVDDSDDVGKVHAGIVMFLDLPDEFSVEFAEPELMTIGFHSKDFILSEFSVESWSNLVLKVL